MHFWEQSDTVLTFFSFSITRRTGIVSFSAHSSGADVVVVVVVVVGFANPSEQVPDSSPTASMASLFSIKRRALSATPSSPKEVPVGA